MRHRTTRGRTAMEKMEYERAKRQKRDLLLVMLLGVGALMLLVTVEFGRAYFCMQDVGKFAENIHQMPPADVKREVQKFADKLEDRNPLIRNAAISALKLATGWRIGSNAGEWLSWWNKHRDQWEYRPPQPDAPGSLMDQPAPWKDLIPPHLLQTSPPPASATSD